MDLMTYKDYRAKVEFSLEDKCFIGRVLGINDVIIFEGESVEELEEGLKSSIDNYLDLCEETGKVPEKEFKGLFNIRTSKGSHRKLYEIAEAKDTSLNFVINEAIELYLYDASKKDK
ncbi:MAG: type II toxin-antitoxin system HicB family antitoxin [Clostridiales Family XIII bacterium]|jgi:predicted HicB family RNase H-like nuclease|nr:type II toxin-antitoxin system HicB family antitoxin [Clostridiales Family XIII bacterium]